MSFNIIRYCLFLPRELAADPTSGDATGVASGDFLDTAELSDLLDGGRLTTRPEGDRD